MNYKQIIALSFYIVLAFIGVLSHISPILLSILYIPYTLLALYTSYYLSNSDDKTYFVHYIKQRFKFPQGIIMLVMQILIILLILFT